MSAEIEEVVVEPDEILAEDVPPDCRHGVLHLGPGLPFASNRSPVVGRRGQVPAIDLSGRAGLERRTRRTPQGLAAPAASS